MQEIQRRLHLEPQSPAHRKPVPVWFWAQSATIYAEHSIPAGSGLVTISGHQFPWLNRILFPRDARKTPSSMAIQFPGYRDAIPSIWRRRLRYQSPSVFDPMFAAHSLLPASRHSKQVSHLHSPRTWATSHRHNFSLDHFWFVQDDYRIKDTLTLNLGFRLESSGGVSEGNNLLSNLDPNNTTPIGTFGSGALGGVDLGGTAFHRNWNPAPRVGFAWNPGRGKLVVRGGYGIAYDYIFLNPITNLRFSAPFLPSLTVQQFTGGNTYAALVAGTAPAQVAIRTAAASGQFLPTQANFGNLSPVDQNLDNPRNQQGTWVLSMRS